jgi:hypothetical protein
MISAEAFRTLLNGLGLAWSLFFRPNRISRFSRVDRNFYPKTIGYNRCTTRNTDVGIFPE